MTTKSKLYENRRTKVEIDVESSSTQERVSDNIFNWKKDISEIQVDKGSVKLKQEKGKRTRTSKFRIFVRSIITNITLKLILTSNWTCSQIILISKLVSSLLEYLFNVFIIVRKYKEWDEGITIVKYISQFLSFNQNHVIIIDLMSRINLRQSKR